MKNRALLTFLGVDNLTYGTYSDGKSMYLSISDGELQLNEELTPLQALTLANELSRYALELLMKVKG